MNPFAHCLLGLAVLAAGGLHGVAQNVPAPALPTAAAQEAWARMLARSQLQFGPVPALAGCFCPPMPGTGGVASPTPPPSPPSALPPLPAGVAELKFADFFVKPVGPRGLELTARIRELDGRRARILGYMVREENPGPGRLLLAPFPIQIHAHDCESADDLPPGIVRVIPPGGGGIVPFTQRLLLLTGTLRVGNRTEPDGRISLVRLEMDSPEVPRQDSRAPTPVPSLASQTPSTLHP